MTQTITLLASGTRGDVQPYLALALGLRRTGYTVRVATHEAFAPAVIAHELPFVRLSDNPSDLFANSETEAALRRSGNWLHSIGATLRYWHDAQPIFGRLLESAWQASQGADALIIGLPTLWGAHIAEALGIACIRGLLQPLTPTSAFPSPLWPFHRSWGARYNRLTYHLVQQFMWQAWRELINLWRRKTLKLPAAPFWQRAHEWPTLYGFSQHVVPRPIDWPPSQQLSGYWVLPPSNDWQPPTALTQFLAEGAPPIFIGFGSMTLARSQSVLQKLLHALTQHNLRAVLNTTHNFVGQPLPSNVFAVQDVPHEWLFPRMAALVHHGGAGTTAAGLRAGVPTLVMPYAVDQYFWGARIFALGAGPRPLALHTFSVPSLAQALWATTHDATMRARAQTIACALNAEDGIACASELIRRWL